MLSIRTARRAAALVGIGAVTLAPLPAAALADSGTSAGDQQYVDPLSGSTTTPSTHHTPSSSSGSNAAAPPASSSGSTGSSAVASTAAPASTAASGATGSTTGKTLPFTGYDGGLAVALGAGLLAGGVLLRRRLDTAER